MGKGAFKDFTIKSLNFKNKMVMAPISSNKADENGFPKEFHYMHYGSKAVGSVGAIIIEGTAIDKKGRVSDKNLGIWSDYHIRGLKKIAASLKEKSVVAGIQLFHGGTSSQMDFDNINVVPVKRIKSIIKSFKLAAKRAIKAGYDIIEINAGSGYLIDEFLSSKTNKREDEYGGTIEKRASLLIEIVREIKSIVKDNKIIAIRLSSNSFESEKEEEELSCLINLLEKEGVDLVDINKGLEVKRAVDTDKDIFKKELPIVEGGLINIVEESTEIVKNHKESGLAFLGKAILRDSYWLLGNTSRSLKYSI
ncbi:NADPH dehydrogenase [Clostridium sp.]|mgnify:CR=1 FL=1|uniref:oxidoreductase n=1 Tax=Clostridium sp. TaxID=1506 RepID=UPI003996724F